MTTTAHSHDHTRQAVLDPNAFPDYQITERKAILQYLKDLINRRVLLSVHLDGGGTAYISAVLAVTFDNEALILDANQDERLNERIVAAETITCNGRIEGVRMQFTVSQPQRFPHDGFEAIRCPLPDMLLRLQRREFYRLHVPLSSPVSCAITLYDVDGVRRTVSVRVLDISNDGIGIVAPPEEAPLEQGKTYEDCVLTIPDAGSTSVTLITRNIYRVTSRSGRSGLRAGCQFVNLPQQIVTNIQRYMYKIQRERRALELAE